jgi:hypothetical protein
MSLGEIEVGELKWDGVRRNRGAKLGGIGEVAARDSWAGASGLNRHVCGEWKRPRVPSHGPFPQCA